MSFYLQLGGLDIKTNEYIIPSKAIKGKDYKCIDCDKKVILRKGSVRKAHFAHYAQTNTCHYYDHPNESQIHKDAKMLMAQLLKDKKQILFKWDCKNCCEEDFCSNDDSTIINKDGDEVFTEYRSKDNKWIADVAIINNNEPRYIIEIKHTHVTVTKRPEPWFEVDATKFIQEVNQGNEDMEEYNKEEREKDPNHIDCIFPYRVPCIRNIDRYCYGSICPREQWVRKIPGYDKTLKDNSCILCHKEDYYPAQCDIDASKFQYGGIRVCDECLFKESYEKKLREIYNGEINIINIKSPKEQEKTTDSQISENELLLKIPKLSLRAGQTQGWKQDVPCTSCGRNAYSPVYENRQYYAMCKICLGDPQTRIDTDKKVKEKNISNESKCLIKF
jgi:hypothetical protein